MTEFLDALADPGTDLIRNALFAGLISSVSFGIVGSFVVTRRISYIAAAIAHSILGGIGAAIYLQRSLDWNWCTPLLGAVIAALLSALLIGVISLRAEEREDTVIGAVWASGMAIGLVFIHLAPGRGVSLETYLFGNILITSRTDLLVTAALGVVVVGVTALFYHQLVAVCFDDEFVRLRGVAASFYYLVLLCLVGLSIVLLVRLTGIILAIALVVLPAATATRFSQKLWKIMALAVLLSMAYSAAGLAFSYPTEMPTGPVVVLMAAAGYALAVLFRRR